MAFERVYTIWDYWDHPRSGLASYAGQPHHYRCEWDEAADDYADTYVLTPIDQETFSIAMEQWLIWQQWQTAFHRGEVEWLTHPALPGSNLQNLEMQHRIQTGIALQSALRERKHAEFRVRSGQESLPVGVIRELEVEWR